MCWYSFREKTPFVFIQSLSWDPGEQTEHSSSHLGGNLQLMQIFITQLTSAERCWFIGDEVFCTVVVFSLFIENPVVLNIGQSSEIRFPDVYSCPQWSSSGFTLAQTRISIHFKICKIPRGISIVFVFLLLWATWWDQSKLKAGLTRWFAWGRLSWGDTELEQGMTCLGSYWAAIG